MVAMAEKKPKKPGRKPKHAGTADAAGRTGKPLGIRIDPKLRDTVPKFIHAFHQKHKVRLDLTSTVEMALTKLFEEWGLLPDESPAPSPA